MYYTARYISHPPFFSIFSHQALSDLCLVVYTALDYGLKTDEERKLSPSLESLFEIMTSIDESNTDDEGIETDGDEEGTSNGEGAMPRVTGMCSAVMEVSEEIFSLVE